MVCIFQFINVTVKERLVQFHNGPTPLHLPSLILKIQLAHDASVLGNSEILNQQRSGIELLNVFFSHIICQNQASRW